MCDLNEGFKLCSCDEEKLSVQEIDWVLKRLNPAILAQHRKGRAAIPQYSANEQICLEKVIAELNTRNCFDFDFEPAKNDRLSLKIAEKWYHVKFSGRSWQEDKSTSLSAWRTQLEKYKEGKIE